MGNNILVEVFVPATGKKYDIFIPRDCRMSSVSQLISAAVNDLSKGAYSTGADPVICDAVSGAIFNLNMMVAELGLENGSQIILI